MKIFVAIFRILTGILFVFSGFVKAVDPIGTEYRFHDYFQAMGLTWLSPFALFFSFLLNSSEFIIGLMLIVNIFPKLTAWSSLGFMLIFTPLTLWLAIANPVTDCGCFGDAITLSNWQTFEKNIVILIVVLFLFFDRKKNISNFSNKTQFSLGTMFFVLVLGFQFLNYLFLPVIDFLPYKEGVSISEKMKYPEGAKKDEFKSVLYYKNLKTGKSEKFTDKNYPWKDTINYKFDTIVNELVNEGYHPPIHDFSLTDNNGIDITDSVLNDKKYSFLFISYNLQKSNEKAFKEIENIVNYSNKNSLSFYCMTASPDEEVSKIQNKMSAKMNFFKTDETALKTIIRSNPGLLLLKNGVIIKKWSARRIPKFSDVKKIYPDL